jgi:hypothetical protein
MLQSVPADSHLRMLCRREEDPRIGSVASVENWAGIPDRDRRASKSGLAKTTEIVESITETDNCLRNALDESPVFWSAWYPLRALLTS